MASIRYLAVGVASLVLAGCGLPKPQYTLVKDPPPYRTEQNGQWIDNEDAVLDAEGYRVDKQGNRIGVIDIPGKTAGESSNAMAGFYISSIGRKAPGNVMAPSEGAGAGAGHGPGSADPTPAGMPSPSSVISPGPASTLGPPASGTPTPITPPSTTPTR